MSVFIRPAQPADRATVLALATAFATSFPIDETAFSQSFDELLTSAMSYLAVAEHEGQIVGYILAFAHPTFYANGAVAWVEEVMVEAKQRRQRIGQALMQSVEAWARERGCKLVALATRRAAEFYRALGYEKSATYFRKVI